MFSSDFLGFPGPFQAPLYLVSATLWRQPDWTGFVLRENKHVDYPELISNSSKKGVLIGNSNIFQIFFSNSENSKFLITFEVFH